MDSGTLPSPGYGQSAGRAPHGMLADSTQQRRKTNGKNRAVSPRGWAGSLAHRRGTFEAARPGRSPFAGAGHGLKSGGLHVHAWGVFGTAPPAGDVGLR